MKNLKLALILLFVAPSAFGSQFTLPTLDPSNMDAIFRTLASTVTFRSVQPASSDGLYGFSLGFTGIQASTEQVTSLIGTGTPQIYDGDISGMIQLPLGLAVEAGFIPSMTISGTSVSRFGGNIKWTFTDLFFSSLPFSAALRATFTNSNLSYSQGLNGSNVNVTYNSNVTGGYLSISKKFLFVEPYIGYGLLSQSSTLSSNSTSFFDGNFASGTTSVNGSGSSGWFQLGVQFKLGFVSLAAEYDNLFLDDTYAVRLAFGF